MWWSRCRRWCSEPATIRTLNGWLTILWLALVPPSILWWSESVPYLVLISVWANIAGHFAAWEAARTEVKQDESSSDTSAPPPSGTDRTAVATHPAAEAIAAEERSE